MSELLLMKRYSEIEPKLKSGSYMCNYCFISECQDIEQDLENSKCKGLTKEDSQKGFSCAKW